MSRETDISVATLSDWRRGKHVPREFADLLKVVRLLSERAGQGPPSIARWRQLLVASGPLPAGSVTAGWAPSIVALGDRLEAAFSESHVEIDAVCLNGQSLSLAMGRPIQAIYAETIHPEKIDVRVLLPSRDISLAFPCAIEPNQGEFDPVHQGWLSQRNAHGQSMRMALLSLRETHRIDVHVTFRALPFTPMAKVYLINGKEALFSYYMVARRTAEIDLRSIEVYDPGPRGIVRLFGMGKSEEDDIFVEQSHLWFNAIWECVSTEMTLIN
ncbi:GntR family transcriptional regulator [Streptomyces sp. NPDC087305]|uniref:GntR family transcriptional regulator n=1 Tax=Streptomyces sp. NPDC087305 TaxID=3365781 RepID=UPI003813982C